MGDVHLYPADHDPVCKWCGVFESDHSRDVLASECYPAMLAAYRKDEVRLRAALCLIRLSLNELTPDGWSEAPYLIGVIDRALAPHERGDE